jgi:hypothetical protein
MQLGQAAEGNSTRATSRETEIQVAQNKMHAAAGRGLQAIFDPSKVFRHRLFSQDTQSKRSIVNS